MSDSSGRVRKSKVFDRMRSLFGAGQASARDDIEDALANASDRGITDQERLMLRNILRLHEIHVHDIMVPRGDIVAVSADETLGAVLNVFKDAGHSRLAVFAESLDDPRGMVHIRDLVSLMTADSSPRADWHQTLERPLADLKIVRPVLFVPPSMPVLDLLIKMQAARTHLALVIDEFGGTDGLASIEDIVEMIVGEIEDEHDESEEPLISERGDGSWLIDGRCPLDEVDALTGLAFAETPNSDSIETIGGYVTMIAGRIPVVGDTLDGPDGSTFKILEADARRISKLELRTSRSEN